jgi:hypothetical protein
VEKLGRCALDDGEGRNVVPTGGNYRVPAIHTGPARLSGA